MEAPKPRTRYYHPELTRLPSHGLGRKIFRWLVRWVARLVVALVLRTKVQGLENIPSHGPALIITNHLGDADSVLLVAHLPLSFDSFAAIDLYFDYPLLGKIMDTYGVIWVHRGTPDRRALRLGLQGLAEGRIIAIAPEGRESLTGALEEGTSGAAFLALHAGSDHSTAVPGSALPLIPLTYTGTSNKVIYPHLRRLLHLQTMHRLPASLSVGPAFYLKVSGRDREALERATTEIMLALSRQLPQELRGVYSNPTGLPS